jgi:hypothetical protein
MPVNLNNVISNSELVGGQYATVEKVVATLTNLHLAPVDVAAGVAGLQNATNSSDAVGSAINPFRYTQVRTGHEVCYEFHSIGNK